jgi:hypothetical protein
MWRRRKQETLADVIELLSGIGLLLQSIDATLEEIAQWLEDEG